MAGPTGPGGRWGETSWQRACPGADSGAATGGEGRFSSGNHEENAARRGRGAGRRRAPNRCRGATFPAARWRKITTESGRHEGPQRPIRRAEDARTCGGRRTTWTPAKRGVRSHRQNVADPVRRRIHAAKFSPAACLAPSVNSKTRALPLRPSTVRSQLGARRAAGAKSCVILGSSSCGASSRCKSFVLSCPLVWSSVCSRIPPAATDAASLSRLARNRRNGVNRVTGGA